MQPQQTTLQQFVEFGYGLQSMTTLSKTTDTSDA